MDPVVKTRIKVGAALAVVILGLLTIDHFTGRGLCLGLIYTAAVVFGLREFAILAASAGAAMPTRRLMLAGAVLALLPLLGEEAGLAWAEELTPLIWVLFLFSILIPPLGGAPSKAVFAGITASAFGLLYVWFLASYILRLRYLPGDGVGEAAVLYTIFIAKGTDIFAFFVGKYFGRRKLIPNISPGKTVAGFVGGMGGAVIITASFLALTPLSLVLPWRFFAPFAIVVGLIVVAGDLIESLIKRSVEVKDSAKLLPTFGGILDVIDSILAAAPVVYYGLYGIAALS